MSPLLLFEQENYAEHDDEINICLCSHKLWPMAVFSVTKLQHHYIYILYHDSSPTLPLYSCIGGIHSVDVQIHSTYDRLKHHMCSRVSMHTPLEYLNTVIASRWKLVCYIILCMRFFSLDRIATKHVGKRQQINMRRLNNNTGAYTCDEE